MVLAAEAPDLPAVYPACTRVSATAWHSAFRGETGSAASTTNTPRSQAVTCFSAPTAMGQAAQVANPLAYDGPSRADLESVLGNHSEVRPALEAPAIGRRQVARRTEK
jgi:hypothetical protein